eukprot:5144350-Pyramimonas_sp.AAC.1
MRLASLGTQSFTSCAPLMQTSVEASSPHSYYVWGCAGPGPRLPPEGLLGLLEQGAVPGGGGGKSGLPCGVEAKAISRIFTRSSSLWKSTSRSEVSSTRSKSDDERATDRQVPLCRGSGRCSGRGPNVSDGLSLVEH